MKKILFIFFLLFTTISTFASIADQISKTSSQPPSDIQYLYTVGIEKGTKEGVYTFIVNPADITNFKLFESHDISNVTDVSFLAGPDAKRLYIATTNDIKICPVKANGSFNDEECKSQNLSSALGTNPRKITTFSSQAEPLKQITAFIGHNNIPYACSNNSDTGFLENCKAYKEGLPQKYSVTNFDKISVYQDMQNNHYYAFLSIDKSGSTTIYKARLQFEPPFINKWERVIKINSVTMHMNFKSDNAVAALNSYGGFQLVGFKIDQDGNLTQNETPLYHESSEMGLGSELISEGKSIIISKEGSSFTYCNLTAEFSSANCQIVKFPFKFVIMGMAWGGYITY